MTDNSMRARLYSWIGRLLIWIATLLIPAYSSANPLEIAEGIDLLAARLEKVALPNDGIIIAGNHGNVLIAKNADQMLIPASILKILTSLAAIDLLGKDYCFRTEFYQSVNGDLIIKGYGDPLLVSEKIEYIAQQIALQIDGIKDIVLDDSYFTQPIRIPGRNNTDEPYDAMNGALIANFNTVKFIRERGRWVSGEPQTPLLPIVIPRIEASGLSSGRISIGSSREESLRYTGELFLYFFNRYGIRVDGVIRFDKGDTQEARLLWNYNSDYPLIKVIDALLEYSNNYIANQILLVMGAHQFGAPATLEKGVDTLMDYCRYQLGIRAVHLVEGSGLARENRISARSMLHVLEDFLPYRDLMRRQGRQQYKTGTLQGVSSRAGYLDCRSGGPYRFVVIRNAEGRDSGEITDLIQRYLK